MKRISRRNFLKAAGVGAAALGLAACGSSSSSTGSSTTSSAAASATPAEDVTIKVAAIETAYGSEMWQKVTEAFTAQTGIKVELTTDKNLEDVIGPSMQGGDYPDVIHLATGKGICVIDLDTVMPGLSAYDFGDSIRTGANDCAEDEPDQSKVHFDLHLYEVFAKGYLSTAGSTMHTAEKRSLAWGAKLMTLECGIRFLTDYLEGDHYFHIARPNHNLDRARTQFTLVRQMEEVFDQMLEIVCPDNH